MRKYILLIALTLAILSSALIYPRYIGSAATTVQAVKMASGDLQYRVSSPGMVDCSENSYVSLGYPVKVKEVYFSIGDKVKAGEKLIEVDKKATLQAIQMGSSSASQQSALSQNKLTDSEKEQLNLSGYPQSSILSQYGVTSSSSSDAAEQASSNSVTNNPLSEADVPDYITAPSAGTITQINAVPGNFTDSLSPLVEISDLNSLEVKAQIDEKQITEIKVGQKAEITGIGLKHTYEGQVSKIYPTVMTDDSSKSVVITLVSFKNQWDELRPNYNVDVNIITADKKNAISVPYESICQDDKNREYVYTVNSGKIYKQIIQSGQETNNSEEITGGLKTGDIVVVNPPEGLKSGQSVNLAQYKPDPDSDSD